MAGHVVIAAAVVLPTVDGSERYLYRGAPVGEGFTEAGIQHALDVGLIAVDTVREELEAALAAEAKAAADKAEADRIAAEKKAADEKKAAEAKKVADAKAAAAAKP